MDQGYYFLKNKPLVYTLMVLCWSLALAAPVTQTDIQDSILKKRQFTSPELVDQDLNSDGIVDVADLVFINKQLPPSVSFTLNKSQVNEDSGSQFINLEFSEIVSNVVLNYSLGGTATQDQDYQDHTNGSVVVNGSTASIEISPVVDTVYEGGETVQLSILPSESFLLGTNRVHTVTLGESSAETSADYLFVLSRDLPGGIGYISSAKGLLARAANISIALSGSTVLSAYINESKSKGFYDSDPGSDIIIANSVSYQNNKITLTFEYQSTSDSYSTSPSLSNLLFNPEADKALPTIPVQEKRILTNFLTIEVDNFDITVDKFNNKQLVGTFKLNIEGVLKQRSATQVSGVISGVMQP
jgi:hypothetical protein